MTKGRRRDAAIALAAGIEARSSHPYAEALRVAEKENVNAEVKKIKDVIWHSTIKNKTCSHAQADALSEYGIEIPEQLNKDKLAEASGHGASILTKGEVCCYSPSFTMIYDRALTN